jgi:hypothetical protein
MDTFRYFEIQSKEPEWEIYFYKSVFGRTPSKEPSVTIEYYRIETKGIQGDPLKRPAVSESSRQMEMLDNS